MRNWLLNARITKGMSRQRVATICKCSYHSIEKYEKGIRRPKPETAQKMGKLLGFDWRLFYEDNSSEPKTKLK